MGRTAKSTINRLKEYVRHGNSVRLPVEALEETDNFRHVIEPEKEVEGSLYTHSLAPRSFAFLERGRRHGQFVKPYRMHSVRKAREARIRRMPGRLREGGTRRKRRTRRKRGTKRSTSRRR